MGGKKPTTLEQEKVPAGPEPAMDGLKVDRAESRRISLELSPVVVRTHTDLQPTAVKSVKGLVHQAAMLCLSDQEFSSFVHLGLEGYFRTGGKWCVLSGRGTVVYSCRFQKGTRALFRVPCLAVDLAADGTAPPGLTITCLIFQPMDDQKLSFCTLGPCLSAEEAQAVNAAAPPAADAVAAAAAGSSVSDAAASCVAAGSASDAVASDAAALAAALPPAAVLPRAKLSSLLAGDKVSPCAGASPAGKAHLGGIVGGVLERVGLNPRVDEAFCLALKEALKLEYDEGTWHVFLGQSEPSLAAATRGGSSSSSTGASNSIPVPRRKYSAKELAGFSFVDPAAHVSALAPSKFVPGSFMEITLARRERLGENPPPLGSPGASASGPKRYHLMFFQTGFLKEASGRAASSFAAGLVPEFLETTNLGVWCAQPLVALRVMLNALGFSSFLGYAWLTHAHENACSRMAASKFSAPRLAPSAGGEGELFSRAASAAAASEGFLGAMMGTLDGIASAAGALLGRAYHAFDLFSGIRSVAVNALGLPPIAPPDAGGAPFEFDAQAAAGGGAASSCSLDNILDADLRLARGRFLIFITLVAIMLSVLVLKPAQKIGTSLRSRDILSGLSRQTALAAAQSIRLKKE